MFDRIIDLLMIVWDQILPFEIVDHYNRGVRLRLGKHKGGVLGAGFHWKIPFFDSIIQQMIKAKTINLSEQTITTKDGTSIVVRAVIKYEVDDVETLLLEVNDAIDALADMTKGIIRKTFIDMNWADCNNPEVENTITKKARVESKKWGVKIIEVTITDLGDVPSFRLFNSSMKDEDYTP
jgi:regulator of protease activity HflC (stomatin/prohibitin superfamily)